MCMFTYHAYLHTHTYHSWISGEEKPDVPLGCPASVLRQLGKVCMYIRMHVCMYISMCMYVCNILWVVLRVSLSSLARYVCTYVCMYVCIFPCACMYAIYFGLSCECP